MSIVIKTLGFSLYTTVIACGATLTLNAMQASDFDEWRQLLVQVENGSEETTIIRVVYLGTTLQRLLYDPSIATVDKNLASK